MKHSTKLLSALLVLTSLVTSAPLQAKEKPIKVTIPSGVNHSAYDQLLKKYVDGKGLVAYEKWKNDAADIKALDNYLKQYAATGKEASGNDKAASSINAYNAFTMQWILRNYPIESIWQLKDSFEGKRHEVGGKEVSLDDIEQGTLNPQIGYKEHAVLVCAARSCPPLSRDAYSADKLDSQIDAAFTRWLGRPDLTEFQPKDNAVAISSIFKWFKKDFDKVGGVPKIFAHYAPSKYEHFLKSANYTVNFKSYNWGLNDQGTHGRNYTTSQFLLDKLF